MQNEPNNVFTESAYKDVKVKDEPDYSETDEEDSFYNVADPYGNQLLTNTIIKEEIIIECEPDVEVFEVGFVNDVERLIL